MLSKGRLSAVKSTGPRRLGDGVGLGVFKLLNKVHFIQPVKSVDATFLDFKQTNKIDCILFLNLVIYIPHPCYRRQNPVPFFQSI